MKKQSLLLLICLLFSSRSVFAVACSGGTFITPTGSINDGFLSRPAAYVALPTTVTISIGSPWRTGAGAVGSKTQYIYTAAELASGGFVAGPITHLAWVVTSPCGGPTSVPGFTISMAHTGSSTLTTTFDAAGTTVYGPVSDAPPTVNGIREYTLTTPFVWDGVSNIEITVCHGIRTVNQLSPDVEATTIANRTSQSTTVNSCSETAGALSNTRPVVRLRQEPVYDNGASCLYFIQPGAGYSNITLNFSEFVTESNADYVVVYDGGTVASPVLGSFHGNLSAALPSVTSTGNIMLVKFYSDASTGFKGWAANYVSNVFCGGTTNLTAPSAVFSDGSGAGAYLNNSTCEWRIDPGAAFSSITLDFTAFQTESTFDFVRVYDGPTVASPLIGTFTGSSIPASLTSSGNQMLVRFTSDGVFNFDGFTAHYQAHYCNATTIFTTNPGPVSFSDGSGASDYLDNTSCSWFINPVLGPLETVGLSFSFFQTELGFDHVNVYDGPNNLSPLLGSFSGAAIPTDVHSSNGTPMYVEFISDNGTVKAGWDASYIINCTPTITISGNTTICANELATFTAVIQNGGGAPSVEWFVNGVSVFTGASFSTTTLQDGDVVYAELTSSAACAYPLKVTSNLETMLVHPLPTVGIISVPDPAIVCDGDPVTLSGTGALTYAWDNGITDAVPFVQAVGTTTYTVIGTDVFGCTNTASIDVTVNPLPTPNITSNTGSFIFCNHTSIVMDAGSYVSYVWSTGATTELISTNSGNVYTVTVTDINGCTASTSVTTQRLGSLPSKPGSITGPINGLCNSSGNPYSINSVNGATSYEWTVTNGTVSSGQGTESVTIDFFGGFITAVISVRSVNPCGVSSWRTKTIYGKPVAPLTINGEKNGVCNKSGIFYSVDPVDGASTYNWTVPAGITLVGGQGTNQIEVNFTAAFPAYDYICVNAANSCGISTSICIKVTSRAQKPFMILGPVGVCAHQSGVVYTTPSVYGATSYTWHVPHGSHITSGQGTSSITVDFGSHDGEVKVRSNSGCGSSNYRCLNVDLICREVENVIADNELNVYPNPTNDYFSLNIPSETNQKCVVKMIDIIGKQMLMDAFEINVGSNIRQYDVTEYAKGLYFVVIEREGKISETIRVIVD